MSASLLFVDDLNGHHQEWFGSMTTIVMVLQPLTSRLCLVVISWLWNVISWLSTTLARVGKLDLLMTGVSNLVQVAIIVP